MEEHYCQYNKVKIHKMQNKIKRYLREERLGFLGVKQMIMDNMEILNIYLLKEDTQKQLKI